MSFTEECSLYVYDEPKWRSATSKNYLLAEKAKIFSYEEALLLPPKYIKGTSQKYGDGILEGGVCDSEGRFVAGLKRSYSKGDVNKNCSFSYEVPNNEVELRDEDVIFGGLLTSHFGHMLYDGMTRLWYPALNSDDQRKIVFLLYPNQVFKYWDLLDLAGIDQSRIEIIMKPTRFKSVLIPEETIYSLGNICYRQEWAQLLSVIRNNAGDSFLGKKVYLTRTKLADSGCVGEEYFEAFFAAKGFEIVSPELLSIKEQISLAAGAEEIVATMGTIASHIMFAAENTHLTVLNRSRTVVGALMASVHVSGARLSLVDVYKNILPEEQGGGSCFLLAPTIHWEKYLRKNYPSANEGFEEKYDLYKNMYDYIIAWGKRYQTPQGFQWIRNETLPDIVARVNLYLRGVEIDTSQYPTTKKMEALEADNERLRATAPERAVADVTIAADDLELSGTVPICFLSSSELCMDVVLFPRSEHPFASKCGLSKCKEGIAWHARIPFSFVGKEFDLSSDSSDLRVTAELRIARGEEVVHLPLKNSYGDADVRVFTRSALPDRTAIVEYGSLRQGPELFLLESYSKAIGVYTNYEITAIEWKDDLLDLSGWVENPLINEEGTSVELRLYNETGEAISQTVDLARLDTSRCSWSCTLNLIDTFNPIKLTRSRWMYSLALAIDGGETLIPFGRRRPVGSFAKYSKKTICIGDCLITPIESKDKQLGFMCVPQLSKLSVIGSQSFGFCRRWSRSLKKIFCKKS